MVISSLVLSFLKCLYSLFFTESLIVKLGPRNDLEDACTLPVVVLCPFVALQASVE